MLTGGWNDAVSERWLSTVEVHNEEREDIFQTLDDIMKE